tara:strand:+ start:3082 stop:3540 length:459 start_codon:yes stop_codon:yes gene_type:complete
MRSALEMNLGALLGPTIEALGYELVGVEMAGGGGTLRVYIDREEGISVDDCARASREVSAVLDVEDPIRGTYTLEVSSPGVDRPLFSEADFKRFVGSQVRLQMSTPRPVDGRRRFEGRLVEVTGGELVVADEDTEHRLASADVAKARLVGEI